MARKKMLTVNEIEVLSTVKVCTFFYGLMGLIQGILTALFPDFMIQYIPTELQTLQPTVIAVMLPLSGLIAGLILGILTAVLYNLIAKYIGGIKIRTK